jgi:carboxylesterase
VSESRLVGSGTPSPTRRPGRFPALLGFHGLTATPRELDPIADLASAQGLCVSVPLLPGHGHDPAVLARTTFLDFTRAAERELERLVDGNPERQIVAAGLSTGALVALRLAAEHPTRVRALVLLANALTLASPYPAWPLRLLHHARSLNFQVPKRSGPDINDPEARANHLCFDVQPVRAAAEVQRAGDLTRALLGRVRCPVFIAHGRQDHVCPVDNAWAVADGVGTNDVEVMILERSFHIVTEDFDRDALCAAVARFLSRVTSDAS